jgi:hypothetical protein
MNETLIRSPDPDQREMLRKIAFIEPVPSVKRVVFLSTPHRGSYIAGSWLAHQAAKLIVLPADVARLGTAAVTRNREKLRAGITGFGTSVFGMTPGQPFLRKPWPTTPGSDSSWIAGSICPQSSTLSGSSS